MRVYPLGREANAAKMNYVSGSGVSMNTIHANNFKFYEEINQIIQEEPASAINVETLGALAAIGIEKGRPFEPDARMQKILTDAAAVANATARASFSQVGPRKPTSTPTAPGTIRSWDSRAPTTRW